jgi:Ca2+:H+ antiporter
MEGVVAINLKKKLRRHASAGRVATLGRPNGGATERSSLLDPPAEYRDDGRKWVRWPMNTVYLTYKTLASNYINVFLIFVPLGIIAGATGWNPTAVFVLNFLAIIPLASLLSFATEELSMKLGQTLGGLLNATFGNAVELIVSPVGDPSAWHADDGHRSAWWR